MRMGDGPVTVASLTADLGELGVPSGGTVIVHSSLSALGWVAGGAQSVVEALIDVVGSDGTIVMPTQSGHLSDPADWSQPPVPKHWVQAVRDSLPAYDPYRTPVRGMGAIVESFLLDRAVVRSDHPTLSFAARGPMAESVVDGHQLADGFGETSPLGALYELDATVVMLGVGYSNCTSLHLAEHRASWPSKRRIPQGAPVLVDGERRWVAYEDLEPDDDDFAMLGEAFEATDLHHEAPVGAGVGKRCGVRDVVDFAVEWMEAKR